MPPVAYAAFRVPSSAASTGARDSSASISRPSSSGLSAYRLIRASPALRLTWILVVSGAIAFSLCQVALGAKSSAAKPPLAKQAYAYPHTPQRVEAGFAT